MKKIKLKIKGYDEDTNSLIVSFASDETQSQNPDDYQSYAYQPMTMWPDIDDVNEITKRIAQAGIYLAEQQSIKEKFKANPSKIAQYKALIGNEVEFNVADITSTTSYNNEVNV